MFASSEWCLPLNKTIHCSCGKEHRLDIHEILVGYGVLDQLLTLCERTGLTGAALILADPNTWAVAGERSSALLKASGKTTHSHLFVREHTLHPDDAAFDEGMKVLSEVHPDFLIAVGSGTINDLTKWLATEAKLPYISVATAPSMDGYGSPGAAVLHNKLKISLPVRSAHAILADYEILRTAPSRMLGAGFGDLMGKYTCNSDWILAEALLGEYRCAETWNVIRKALSPCVEGALAGGFTNGPALETLTQGLINSGLAMLLVGGSRPAGGSEHSVSHFWEMTNVNNGKEPDMHGRMVGVGAIAVTGIYEYLLALEKNPFEAVLEKGMPASLPIDEPRVREVYGKSADGALKESRAKELTTEQWEDRMKKGARIWPELKLKLLETMTPAFSLKPAFIRAGAPTTPEEVGQTREELRRALEYARYLRQRYTVFDLISELGILDETVDWVLSRKF